MSSAANAAVKLGARMGMSSIARQALVRSKPILGATESHSMPAARDTLITKYRVVTCPMTMSRAVLGATESHSVPTIPKARA